MGAWEIKKKKKGTNQIKVISILNFHIFGGGEKAKKEKVINTITIGSSLDIYHYGDGNKAKQIKSPTSSEKAKFELQSEAQNGEPNST